MKSSIVRGILPFTMFATLVGCAVAPDSDAELTEESATENAVGNPEAYTFFEIAKDLRRCSFPRCGGWFITRLNEATTRCHDGRYAASCYTPVLDWSQSELIEAQQAVLLAAADEGAIADGVKAIVRGRFGRTNTTPRPDLGRFVISEAWTAENAATSDGAFVRIRDNGVRCFAPPCPSLTEMWLNNDAVTNIYGMDYTAAELTEYQFGECAAAIQTTDGMLTAGYRYSWTENNQAAIGRTATAVFMRLTNQRSP
jgi:hypothetical protein